MIVSCDILKFFIVHMVLFTFFFFFCSITCELGQNHCKISNFWALYLSKHCWLFNGKGRLNAKWKFVAYVWCFTWTSTSEHRCTPPCPLRVFLVFSFAWISSGFIILVEIKKKKKKRKENTCLLINLEFLRKLHTGKLHSIYLGLKTCTTHLQKSWELPSTAN